MTVRVPWLELPCRSIVLALVLLGAACADDGGSDSATGSSSGGSSSDGGSASTGSAGATAATSSGSGSGSGATATTGTASATATGGSATGSTGASSGGAAEPDPVGLDWLRELWTTSRHDVPGGAVATADGVYVVGTRSDDLEIFGQGIDNGKQQFRLTRHDRQTGEQLALLSAECTGFFNVADVTHGRDIAADAAGNLYVAGHARCQEMTLSFEGKQWSVNTEILGDAVVIGLLPTLEPRWIETQESNSEDKAESIAVFGDSVYVAGHFAGSTLTVDGMPILQNKGNFDVYVVEYTTDGAPTGRAVGIGGAEDEGQPAIFVDAAGNVYVTGYMRSSPTLVYDGQGVLASLAPVGLADAFVVALAPDLSLAWATVVGGPADDKGKGIVADGGRIFVGGYTEGGITVPGCCTVGGIGGRDAFVAVLDDAGMGLAANVVGGPGTDRIYDLALVPDTGRVWAAGSFGDQATFGDFVLTSAGGREAFFAAFDGDATVRQALGAAGAQTDEGTALAGAGNVLFVAGSFESKPWSFEGTTLPGSGEKTDAFLGRLSTMIP